TKFFWGAGEQVYVIPDQSVYTGNSIMNPTGQHVQFRTAAYMPNWCVGCPKIRSGDSFNNNTYSSPFSATFWADYNDDGVVDWNTWKTDTLNAGNAFDTNSTVVSSIPDKIVVLANEYETQRGNLAIYNWSLSSTKSADLSSILPNGTDFVVLDPRNMGTPVYQGTYNGPVNIPTSGKEFLALLVLGSGSAPPPPPPPDTTPPDTTITSNFCGTTVNTSTVTVTWTGSDDTTPTGNLVYAYNLDSGNYSSYSSATSHTFNNLSNGSHTVSVKAKDEAGNVDPSPATCTFTVNVADTTPPVLSNVTASNITMTDATIIWNTDENSDSQVEYGTSPCPCGNNTPLDTNMVTSHSRTITGLTANTTYHYRAKSRDASGNIGYSNDQT
ncbi:fibronectin type III domain-containing protein, partial [bacterium]|nr:fibronectin type III domain-containing protein [bacterium]